MLEKITIIDWRCFYGEQLIEFASAKDKNVTLIHAENGVGKTSLLNALLWCFYRKTTARFEKPDDILNHQASREDRRIASIAVEFSHEDMLYEARRIFRSDNPSASNEVIVTQITLDGKQEAIRTDPNYFLNSVLPVDMAGHFLFDGEHAEALTVQTDSASVSSAIKDILGCTFVNQSIQALEVIETGYRRKATSMNALKESEEISKNIKKYDAYVSKKSVEKSNIDLDIAKHELERNSIESQLSSVAAIKQSQLIKVNTEKTVVNEQRYEKRALAQQQLWLSKNASQVLGCKLASRATEIFDQHSRDNSKVSSFNKEVILKILSVGECVCGTEIKPNNELEQHLRSQLQTAESLELQDRIIKTTSLVRRLKSINIDDKLMEYRKTRQAQSDHFEAAASAEISLSEISKALEAHDLGKISQLQSESSILYRKILNYQKLKGEISVQLVSAEKKLRSLNASLDEINRNAPEGKKILKNQLLVKTVKARLTEKLAEELENARKIINGYIKEIIEKTARKDFKVRIDNNFSVKLMDEFGTDMPKSEGENQLLGLAFTGALAKFAKLRKNARSKILLPGTEAPLVLDAPFGKLDPVYKHATANFLPEMSSQVIVMVNQEQGSPKVLELLKDRVGYQYALVRHNRSPQNSKTTETLRIDGKNIDITLYDSLFDGTGIEVV